MSQVRDDIIDANFDVLTGEFKEKKEESQHDEEPEDLTAMPSSINDDYSNPDVTAQPVHKVVKRHDPQDECLECRYCRALPRSDLKINKEEDSEQEQEAVKKRIEFEIERAFQVKKQKRLNVAVHMVLTYLLQIVLIMLTYNELFTQCFYWYVFISPVQIFIMFARFICTTILHLSCVDSINSSLLQMKFCLNHPYLFQNFFVAWFASFLQFTSCIQVEIASIIIICSAGDTIDIVFNFIALAIIAEFDNFVFSSLKNESFKKLNDPEFCGRVLVVKHTTSKKCKEYELTDVKNEETGEYRPLKVTFMGRTLLNKCLYLFYKLVRMFYVSTFYYFLPFSAVVISTLVPLMNRAYVEHLIANEPDFCPDL